MLVKPPLAKKNFKKAFGFLMRTKQGDNMN
jgi:hypothetical protein